MLVVLISWLYMALICFVIGNGVLAVFKKQKFSIIQYLVGGIITITVYVEYFSLIGKIGVVAHLLLLVFAILCGYMQRKRIVELLKEMKEIIFSWEGFFYLCFLLGIAFFTSRGTFHTDTNIYHAQAIRMFEEYGLIKGMANLQLHFGYNSAYLAFASIFSMNWLFGQSVHTTTGFIEVIFCIYAFHGLKDFKQHRCHIADMMRVGILFYALIMINGSMSPATDYATMFMVLYVITAWCENLEGEKSLTVYALLSVVAVYVVTMKFSACLLVLIVLYPAVCLIKEKKVKEIIGYILTGVFILLPFLIRNFLVSGWLLYPFDGIDIFNVEWKVPKEYLLVDANQIKVWGRCLYDVNKIDWSVSQWLPIWWEGQERYEQMLIGSLLMGTILLAVQFVARRIRKKKITWELVVLLLAIYSSLAVWFFMAPFIRYGLAFIFAVSLIALGIALGENPKGFYSIVSGGLVFCIVVTLSPYWDHYITDAGVFIKQNLMQPYYIRQKDYDEGIMEYIVVNGERIYYAAVDEVNSYHVYPSTCYKMMLERTMLLGDKVEDGFKAK